MKWTPGPWEANLETYATVKGQVEILSAIGENIAKIPAYYAEENRRTANGHMLAAAPEMYDALCRANTNIALIHAENIYAKNAFDHSPTCRDISICQCPLAVHWRHNEAILAKARGEQ